jgi:hypothetical protein
MQGVSWRHRLGAAALVLVLLVPSAAAYGSPVTTDSGLWAEFVAWLASRLDIPPDGSGNADEFDFWLMIRIDIPNG